MIKKLWMSKKIVDRALEIRRVRNVFKTDPSSKTIRLYIDAIMAFEKELDYLDGEIRN